VFYVKSLIKTLGRECMGVIYNGLMSRSTFYNAIMEICEWPPYTYR